MFFMYNNERFKIFEAEPIDKRGESGTILKSDKELVIATIDGAISVTKIQRQGKQVMDIDSLLRGFEFKTGDKV